MCWASPIVKGMVCLHLLAGVGMVLFFAYWLQFLLLLAALHLLVIVAVLTPRNALLGENLTRLKIIKAPGSAVTAATALPSQIVTLTFDDGPDPLVTPQVLDLLDTYQQRASFFVIGEKVQRYPALAKEIVARGHTLENHSFSHSPLFSLFFPSRLYCELAATQKIISETCGQAPRFFRPPAGFRSPMLAPLLSHLDLHLATWTRRGFDTRERQPERVLQRLLHNLAAGDILLMHDGNAALDATGTPVILRVLPDLLQELQRRALVSATLPSVIHDAPRSKRQMC